MNQNTSEEENLFYNNRLIKNLISLKNSSIKNKIDERIREFAEFQVLLKKIKDYSLKSSEENRIERTESSKSASNNNATNDYNVKVNDNLLSLNSDIVEFENKILTELFFCLLTANFSAEGGIKIQNALRKDFHSLSLEELRDKLVSLGHRFPNKRAEYIINARSRRQKIIEILIVDDFDKDKREKLVHEVKGLGYKEASHFLRNIGFKNVAIIDFHILDILEKNNFIVKPRTLTPKRYLEIEEILRAIGISTGLNLSELDLYLWFMETGKILK